MKDIRTMNIQISLSEKEIEEILVKSRFNPSDKDLIRGVNNTIETLIKPSISYFFCEDKSEFEFLEKLDDNSKYAIAVVTLGKYIDQLQEVFASAGEILISSIIDSLCLEIMSKAYSIMAGDIASKYALWVEKYIFPGDIIPLEATKNIVDIMGCDNIKCNNSYVLTPAKTVTIVVSLSRTVCKEKHICEVCSNKKCMFRKVDVDK